MTSLNKLKSDPLAVFTVPSLSTAWNKIAVKVEGSTVKIFINCELADSKSVARPQRIEFDPASSLYIGQGGAKYKKPWEGVIQVCYVLTQHPVLLIKYSLASKYSHPCQSLKGESSKDFKQIWNVNSEALDFF